MRRTAAVLASVPKDRVSVGGVWQAVRGLPWVLRERRPLPERVERRFAVLERAQRTSNARRYVS